MAVAISGIFACALIEVVEGRKTSGLRNDSYHGSYRLFWSNNCENRLAIVRFR